MPNFTAGTSFTDGVTNDVTAAKLNALVADAVPTSSLSLNSTTGTISLFSSGTGTAATPAIQPASDTNTGIFFPAADTIAFSEGGAEAMRINSSGNVGIGETSPSFTVGGGLHIKNGDRANLKLQDSTTNVLTEISIADNGASSNFIVDIDPTNVGSGGCPLMIRTGGGAERLRIDSSGNVGIGISPSQKLDVNGASAIRGTLFLGDGSSSLIRKLTSSTPLTFANNGGSAEMTIDSSGNVGIGTASPINKLHLYNGTFSVGATQLELEGRYNAYGAGINFSSRTSDGGTLATMAKITADGEDSWSTTGTTQDAGLRFSTTANGTLAERLRIDSSGNVGIGTASPATKLTVSGSSGTGSELRVVSTGANTGGRVTLYENTSGCWEFATSGGANSALTIKDLFNNAERLRIDSSGGVTIAGLAGSGSRAVNASAAGLLSAASDASLKEEVVGAHIAGLDEILQIHPKMYRWKDDIANRGENASVELGFIANDVAPIIPSAAPLGNDGLYGFYDRSITAALVKAVQELKLENDSLKARITALESK